MPFIEQAEPAQALAAQPTRPDREGLLNWVRRPIETVIVENHTAGYSGGQVFCCSNQVVCERFLKLSFDI